MYFNDFDYEAFTEENIKLNTQSIRDRRKGIQEKFLNINEDIKDTLEMNYDLYPNDKKQHITSLLYPCEYNRGMVSWIWLRYEKNNHNFFEGKGEDYAGFQKWNNFQISIFNSGIDMGMYHSVPYDSFDRNSVREKLEKDDEKFIKKLISATQEIQGYGYKFKINGTEGTEENFYFDDYSRENVGEEFIKFYEKKCVEGKYSAILIYYKKDDERISTQEKIENEFLEHIKTLYPIFLALSWK